MSGYLYGKVEVALQWLSDAMTVHTEAYYGKSERITGKWRQCEVPVRRRKVALRLYCPITDTSLQHDGGKKDGME